MLQHFYLSLLYIYAYIHDWVVWKDEENKYFVWIFDYVYIKFIFTRIFPRKMLPFVSTKVIFIILTSRKISMKFCHLLSTLLISFFDIDARNTSFNFFFNDFKIILNWMYRSALLPPAKNELKRLEWIIRYFMLHLFSLY